MSALVWIAVFLICWLGLALFFETGFTADPLVRAGSGLLVFGGALGGVWWWMGQDSPDTETRISRDLVRRFFFSIALPVGAVLGGLLLALGLVFDPSDRVWTALVAGLFVATGWLTTAIFAEQGRKRLREEQLRDYHKAIYAEIRDSLAQLWSQGQAQSEAAGILAQMRADEDFVPFIPLEVHDRVFAALMANIEVLPRVTIDPIIAYYSQIRSVEALAADMRAAGFKRLPQARRIRLYEDFTTMRDAAYQLGDFALQIIEAYSDGGAAKAEDQVKALNAAARVAVQASAKGAGAADPEVTAGGAGTGYPDANGLGASNQRVSNPGAGQSGPKSGSE